jgi:hypothetical protein
MWLSLLLFSDQNIVIMHRYSCLMLNDNTVPGLIQVYPN